MWSCPLLQNGARGNECRHNRWGAVGPGAMAHTGCWFLTHVLIGLILFKNRGFAFLRGFASCTALAPACSPGGGTRPTFE